MEISALPRDVIIFCVAAVGGIALGMVTALQGTELKPVWPMRLYLQLLSHPSQPEFLKRRVQGRTAFKFREQLLASSFVWFFVLFVAGQFAFGCGKNGC